MSLVIDYRLAGNGWAECTVQFAQDQCAITASYLSDALANLILAGVAVLAGAHSISVGFDEEPGEYRWTIVRCDTDQVQVRLLEFPQLWGHRPDSEGKLLMQFSLTPLAFGEAVAGAASRLLALHDTAGYKEQWIEHAFPSRPLEMLNEYIERWRHQAR